MSSSDLPISVVFLGPRFSGKDHLTALLLETMRSTATSAMQASFAEDVKIAYAEENPGVDLQRLYTDRSYKERHRRGIIQLGEDMRDHNPLFWIERLFSRILRLRPKIAVFSDVRFPSELDLIREDLCNGDPSRSIVVRLVVSDRVKRERGWVYSEDIDENKTERAQRFLQEDIALPNETVVDAQEIIRHVMSFMKGEEERP